MQIEAHCKPPAFPCGAMTKTWMIMRMTAIFLFAGFLHVAAAGRAQGVTLSEKGATLEKLFRDIRAQTGYTFVYRDEWLRQADKVDIDLHNVSIAQALEACFKNQPLTYALVKTTVVVMLKPFEPAPEPVSRAVDTSHIHGHITDSTGAPLAGASVTVKGLQKGTSTDANGNFEVKGINGNVTLLISFTGFISREYKANSSSPVILVLKRLSGPLDEVQVVGYGTTTRRLSTGDVSTVTSKEIEEQPVSNPIAALEGRVPGLFITQVSGLPGSAYNVQIRGQNSIANGTDPLYIVDGVPFNDQPLDVISLGYPSQHSPFNSISPSDIASIEVLKDADATAIYGSRGANGVILISTKKGKSGKTKVDINVNSGAGKVTRMMTFLNTPQYLEMRREAFKNDNVAMTPENAYDLLLWDTTRYINWQKELIGGTAHTTNVQASISGGNIQTQFLLGASYNGETTVFPGGLGNKRSDVHLNVNHRSLDNKFSLSVTASYSDDVNNLIQADLFDFMSLPPDAPQPYDAKGNLNWSGNGAYFNNPFAYLLQKYTATTDNLIGNTNLAYKILPGLTAKVDAGYTSTALDQVAIAPTASQNPTYNPTSYSQFGTNAVKGWIIEPQLTYTRDIGKGNFEALLGASQQQQITNGNSIFATGYNNDALLGSISGAGSVSGSSDYSMYRYQALFGRLHYIWKGKYILNLTGRRDGSSRFGPGRQYADFGAAGGAWVFSEEHFIKNSLPFLSFGKLRASYGITGNDQIGDYKYLDTWRATYLPYQGISGLQSFSLYNPDYAWEINKKLEAAVDLGFLKDRILLSANFFRNRSSNQLVNYTLPTQTGFSGILENLPALVQNAGWEFTLNTVNINSKDFKWSASFNLTASHNKLLAFPGLANSSYADTYVIGQPLNITKLFHYVGVDPKTGIYQFNGTINPTDKISVKDLTPKYYGGLSNTFTYRGFQVSFFLQFIKQLGQNFYARNDGNFPGSAANEPVQVMNRWQFPGENRPTGVYTTGANIAQVYAAEVYYPSSDAVISDASFIRLKNISVSYKLPAAILRQMKIESCDIYLRGENMLTLTHYFGADPENQNSALPSIRMLVAGIRFTL